MNNLNVSLDEFPTLFGVAVEGRWTYHFPIRQRQEYEDLINNESWKRDSAEDLRRFYDALNTMRLKYAEIDEDLSFGCIQKMLVVVWMDSAMLDILSDGLLGKDDSAAVRSLLTYAERFSNLYVLRSACLIRAAQVFEEYGSEEDAFLLYKQFFNIQWMGDESFYYSELYDRFVADIDTRQPNLFGDLVSNFKPRPDLPADLVERLRLRVQKHGIALTDRMLSQIQLGIRFNPSGEEPKIGGSRFGGFPDVPEGWEWPGELLFVAQFNMEEMAPYDVNGLLPKQGLLQFFEVDMGMWDDEDTHRVYLHEGDLSQLRPATPPPSFEIMQNQHDWNNTVIFLPMPVAPYNKLSMVQPSAFYGENDHNFMKALVIMNKEFEVDDYGSERRNQLLGCTAYNQANASISAWSTVSERPYYLLTENERKIAEPEIDKWILLFQAFTWDAIGFWLSQGQIAHYMIHKDDLAARRFDRVYFSA